MTKKPENNDRFMTVKEVADYLGVSRGTIYNYINKGILPHPTRIGLRTVRWKKSDIDAAIEKQR